MWFLLTFWPLFWKMLVKFGLVATVVDQFDSWCFAVQIDLQMPWLPLSLWWALILLFINLFKRIHIFHHWSHLFYFLFFFIWFEGKIVWFLFIFLLFFHIIFCTHFDQQILNFDVFVYFFLLLGLNFYFIYFLLNFLFFFF